MDLGDQLKSARITSGLTQGNVADKLNISRQAISQWETGKNYPDIDNLVLLSDLYHFNLNELLNENKELREKLNINEQQIKIEKNNIKQINKEIDAKKDEGILLLTISCILFVIAPLGIIIAPLIIWRNKNVNTFFKIIYLVCVCALIYNIIIGYCGISAYFNWGVTSYSVK